MSRQKGFVGYWKGKKRSKETCEKISLAHIGKIIPQNTRKQISQKLKGKIPKNFNNLILGKRKGISHTEESKRKMSESKKGKQTWNKGLKGIYSEETKHKISLASRGRNVSLETRKKMSEAHKGNKCHLWKGGISKQNRTERENIMSTFEYKIWRKAVFERDNWTCVWCMKRGCKLHADHIQLFSEYPELRFAIDNGRTLCINCHNKRHNKTY